MNPALCSQCGHPLIFQGIEESPLGPQAGFICSNCDQQASVSPDGRGGMTLATIFPVPTGPRMHHEFAEHQAQEKRMFARMRVVAGWMSEEEYESWNSDLEGAVERYKADHPLPTLWQRIRKRRIRRRVA